jgi:hypothetical protein
MAESHELDLSPASLLAQDAIATSDQYRDYREKLTRSLQSAQRRERIAFWVCAVSGVLSFVLMFVGGSGVVGSFDPTDKNSTILSTILAVIHVASMILFGVLLASYYSRFRPRTRQAHENLRDLQMLQLAAQVDALQRDVAVLKERAKDR